MVLVVAEVIEEVDLIAESLAGRGKSACETVVWNAREKAMARDLV